MRDPEYVLRYVDKIENHILLSPHTFEFRDHHGNDGRISGMICIEADDYQDNYVTVDFYFKTPGKDGTPQRNPYPDPALTRSIRSCLEDVFGIRMRRPVHYDSEARQEPDFVAMEQDGDIRDWIRNLSAHDLVRLKNNPGIISVRQNGTSHRCAGYGKPDRDSST